jgi:exodeoxyribonuclease V gamma subunit
MYLHVYWSNQLERLAARLAANLRAERVSASADVFAREHCVVLPEPPMQQWLEQYLLYDHSVDGVRILTNVHTRMLYPFVNDWLFWMKHPELARSAAAHPFSVGAMQWRIWDVLHSAERSKDPVYRPLLCYLDGGGRGGAGKGTGPQADAAAHEAYTARRTMQLARQLAKLFDDYQVFRPEMLKAWQDGASGDLAESLWWQPALWCEITKDFPNDTYLQAFFDMSDDLANCEVAARHPAVHVFGVSMMPTVYMAFFRLLGQVLPVHLYVFNPSQDQWDDALTSRQVVLGQLQLEGREDADGLLACRNPLLADMGRGGRNFLAQILDATDLDAVEDFAAPMGDTMLAQLQRAVLENAPPPDPCSCPAPEIWSVEAEAPSILLHSCHSPLRELEVLRDCMYRWFEEDASLQPRHIQVLVADMETYAPYIEAVFMAEKHDARDAIPYVVMDRRSAGENALASAFIQLLRIPDSRFTAQEVMELLHVEGVHLRFGIQEQDLPLIGAWVKDSGIRWGQDAVQRKACTGVDFPEQTTWRHGLDRLLLGYAMTAAYGADAATVLPCDRVDEDGAILLGKLIRFLDDLSAMAREISNSVLKPADWVHCLHRLADQFFQRTDANYVDIVGLHGALDAMVVSAAAASFEGAIGLDVVRDLLADCVQSSAGRQQGGNKVLFCNLRTGAAAPRPYICMLGMGDGCFPRPDNRPAYDLLRKGSRYGDPSLRTADRAAFLEAFMAARRHLHISYVGQDNMEQQIIPAATVVNQLCEYADQYFCKEGGRAIPLVAHKLHPFHPAYFDCQNEYLFSYDADNFVAASIVNRRAGRDTREGDSRPPIATAATDLGMVLSAQAATDHAVPTVELDSLIRFFRHPARTFYGQTLKVQLEDRDAVRFPDDEVFVPDALEGWQCSERMIAALCRDENPDLVYRELCERGVVPLGAWGKMWFRENLNAMREILDQSSRHNPRTIREWLQKQAPLWPEAVDVCTGTFRVCGNAVGIHAAVGRVEALDYRYGSAKAHEILASWIRHLFVCAAGLPENRICLHKKKYEPFDGKFPPLDAVAASGCLDVITGYYTAGLRQALPFTPETTFAYMKTCRGNRSASKGKKAEKDPWDAAAGKWRAGYMTHGDEQDPYYRAAFGDGGPMDDPGFAAIAEKIWGPVFDAIASGEEEASDA